MDTFRQESEGWLDPSIGGRITCHEIVWAADGVARGALQAGGNLYHHRIPDHRTAPHSHDFAEIVLVNSGAALHRVNGEEQRLAAGDLVFIRPDDRHGFAAAPASERVEIVLLSFELEVLLGLSVYLENDVFLQAWTAPVLPPRFGLEPAETGTLYARLLRLNNTAQSPVLRKIRLKILLGELYARFFIDEAERVRATHVPAWLGKLCDAMREEANFCAGVERMRKLACRSPGHLCKAFRRYLGKTPTAFVNELRVNHAARLLADTDEDILGIAYRLDFGGASRFYHLFRRHYGLPPAAYRKLHVSRQPL